MKVLTVFVIITLVVVAAVALLVSAGADDSNKKFHKLVGAQQQYIIPANNEQNQTNPASPNFIYINEPNYYGHNSTVRVFTLKNPADHWTVECPGCNQGDCTGVHETVSTQAKNNDCLYSTNGGPFSFVNMSTCFGPLVSNGKIVAHAPPSGTRGCLGLFKKGSRYSGNWILANDNDLARSPLLKELQQLLCGFNYLVLDGKPQYSSVTEIAPRTAVGIDGQGNLISVVADGAEATKPPEGLTLNETADLMLGFGCRFALNLDGGGSSTTFFDGSVRGCPTANDGPKCIEREVITTQCVK